jgi:EAL domain-containing protein (putative c-di-GMP-specific phosphodiesterase class I)
MYHAKELGKNNYQRYSPTLHARSPKRLELETSLRHALDRQEFRLHYQPKIDVITGRLRGMEALLRWQHPEIGLIAPLEFIPLLEETGLIVEVGAWVLQTACMQAKAWQEAGFPDLCVAVNLSARQFTQHNLSETVVKALRESGLQPRCLELELTESILIEHSETTLASLRELSGMGIQLAIDDFGTGYSSLSYLTRFPIDTLKVDRSFVHDIATDPDDAAIVQAVIVMAHSLGLTVVAEGVETKDQLDFLRRNRCDEIQGYYFSRPLASEAFALLLEEYRRLNESARDKGSPGVTSHSPADVVTKISRH